MTDDHNNSDIDTILKMLFSPRSSHFNRDYRSRTGTPRNSVESGISRMNLNYLRDVGELYHRYTTEAIGNIGWSVRLTSIPASFCSYHDSMRNTVSNYIEPKLMLNSVGFKPETAKSFGIDRSTAAVPLLPMWKLNLWMLIGLCTVWPDTAKCIAQCL